MLPGAAEEGALPLRSLPGMGAPGRAHRGCRLTKDSQAAVSVAPRHSPGWPGLWSLSWKCHCTLQANLWDFQEEWLQASPRQRKAPPGRGLVCAQIQGHAGKLWDIRVSSWCS